MKPVELEVTDFVPEKDAAEAKVEPKKPIKAAEVMYGKDDAWIETVDGGQFHFAKPHFDIGAVAHSLSMVCRFTGHCNRFYSVAEHSVLVSRIMEDLRIGPPLEGLLHDGVESVLADVASPAKVLLKDYKSLDHALDKALRKQFALPAEKTEGCIKADWLALAIEANELLPSKGRTWNMPDGIRQEALQLGYRINAWNPEAARDKFMQRMADIRRRLLGLR